MITEQAVKTVLGQLAVSHAMEQSLPDSPRHVAHLASLAEAYNEMLNYSIQQGYDVFSEPVQ